MKKLLIIILILAILVLLSGLFIVFGAKPVSTGNPSGGNVTLPTSGNVPVSVSGNSTQGQPSITVTGAGGITIPTRDFLHEPTTGEYPNKGYFYLGYHTGTDTTATINPPYLIEYIAATQYFDIELLKEPIGAARSAAEQFLTASLGISQDQMCELNYTVSVPSRVNSQFASKNLGFSFCPGATALPD